MIYRFRSSLYYANAHQLLADVTAFVPGGQPLTMFCLDAVAIGDIDFTAAAVLGRVHHQLAGRGARLVMCEVAPPVRAELDRYGITALISADAFYPSPKDVVTGAREPS